MRGSQNGCHFYFGRMAVLVAVPQNISELAGNCSGPTPNQRPIHLKSSRETHAVILPTKRALGG
jgi:hypothetical protein